MPNRKQSILTLSDHAKLEIRKYINTMNFSENNKLPREELLAEMIGVSRITIRQALNDLAAEGIVFRRQGKGTFVNVASLNMKVRFNPCMEFSQIIRNSGYEPSVILGDIKKAAYDQTICEMLHMEKDEILILAEKMFLADGQFCVFCRDYLSAAQLGGTDALLEFSQYDASVFQYLYQVLGKKCEWDKVEIDTILSSNVEGLSNYIKEQELENMPLLYLKGVNYTSDDTPILYANEYINTKIIKFNMIRKKNIVYVP